ncbi:hypothetical protein Q5H93_12110 [Hymenobacter sp. ASUV-10]|uniref:Uncharacterized protein n=1 Tax=Hymenobacter aranciens TaxID=3063996 RepID=A0ABT9BB62_9BACT|nr:hypothetical protein [Hymenobacter sp. ASUV-10]MDO7875478.1 hypothetical protein [Hymenobacter sp. ASUV-10]
MEPTPNPGPATAPAYTPFIPRDQDEKAALCLRLATAWKKNPQLVLIWITQAAFETKAKNYYQSVIDKTAVAAKRGGITLTLEEADDKIREGLPYLKAILLTKFKKGHDKAKYPEFGIITRNDGFELPKKHTERAKALTAMLKALKDYSLEDGEFGTEYWGPIEQAYVKGDKDSKDNDATVGSLVGTKDALEDEVTLVLSKMLTLLEAQYPDEKELAGKRRELGYLKEYS